MAQLAENGQAVPVCACNLRECGAFVQSRAPLTYGDLRTCLSEENLSNILFAAYNYDPSSH